MATTKYHGKNSAIIWRKTGGSAVDLSGSSRKIGLQEQASDIDVSTRDDAIANQQATLVGVPSRTATVEGLDTTPQSSRTWRTGIAIGDAGQLAIYPEGTGSGKYYELMDATVQNTNFDSPHDNAASWKLDWKVTTAPASGQVS